MFVRHWLRSIGLKLFGLRVALHAQKIIEGPGTSLVVQWVRLHAPNAGGLGLIPGWGTRSRMPATTKSPHATTKRFCMLQRRFPGDLGKPK